MKRHVVAALVLGAALALTVTGCTATVSGHVVGHTSGEPIVGAVVTVSGESTRTDAHGDFTLAGIDKGAAKGSVTSSGFPETTFNLDLSRGNANQTVALTDAVVTVTLKEAAVEPQAISSATVTLDGRPVTLGQPLGDIAPGTHTLAVQAKDHEPYSAQVEVAPGQDSLVATMSLTVAATYRRYYDAYAFARYRAAYKYLHPDVKKKESYKAFVRDMGSETSISLTLGAERILKTWRSSSTTKRTYHNVTEIDRTYVYQGLNRNYTDKESQHWVMIKGVWFIIWA
jgi:hypothetical protein